MAKAKQTMNSLSEDSLIDELDMIGRVSGSGESITSLPLHDLRQYCRSEAVSVDGLRSIFTGFFRSDLDEQSDTITSFILLFDICGNQHVTYGMVQCVAEFIPWAATASAADANGITPLHLLCSNKNATVDIVRCLIEGNAEALRSQDKAGKTPLVYLCSNNELDERVSISMDMLTLLLEMCPESAQCCTHDGHLPISYACEYRSPKFCCLLIDAYPDTIQHEVGGEPELFRILFSKRVGDRVALAVLKQLIDKNPDIDLCVRLIGMAFFHQAARENISRAAEIRSFLNQAWPELVVKFLSVFEHDENEVGYKPAVVDTSVCASCGIAEVDDIKLKECTDCDLVRYCSDECQKEHESQHVEACKKRAAELRDELLFKQPESSHIGDCPICMLPLPLDKTKSTLHSCCSKVICNGCYFANYVRETKGSLQQRCPFCRKPASSTEEETGERRMKRVEANDPLAILTQGQVQLKKGDDSKAFEYMMKAAESHLYAGTIVSWWARCRE